MTDELSNEKLRAIEFLARVNSRCRPPDGHEQTSLDLLTVERLIATVRAERARRERVEAMIFSLADETDELRDWGYGDK